MGAKRAICDPISGAKWAKRHPLGSRPDMWCKKVWVTGANVGSELPGW